MLLPKNITFGILSAALLLASASEAGAGLFGFDQTAPYTKEEKMLGMDYLPDSIRNYRADMRNNLLMLIDYAHRQNPNFQILSHEGQDILHKSSWEYALEGYERIRRNNGKAYDPAFLFDTELSHKEPELNTPEYRYLNAINAVVLNNYYCGEGKESRVTTNHSLGHISIEHCADEDALDNAIIRSLLDKKAIYPFTGRKEAFRSLSNQPMINDSARNITEAKEAQNIAFLLDDYNYNTKEELIGDVSNSNYDIIVINPLFQNRQPFSADDVRRMQFKKNGGKRLLIASMNVSEASPQDYFWKKRWRKGNPSWLVRESFVTPGAYITRYWSEEWRQILSRHFKDIVATGYDGIFFTGIENHAYFEYLTPLE